MSINVPVNPLNQSEFTYLYLTPEQALQLRQWLTNWRVGDEPLTIEAMSGDVQIAIAMPPEQSK